MNKKKKMNAGRIATIIGIIAVLVIAAILIVNVLKGKNGGDNNKATDQVLLSETGEDPDVIPYGDNESDNYQFSGDYFDIATQNATMTISQDGQAYTLNITYAETDDAITIWKMTASYDKSRKALLYRDCTRTDYITEEGSEVQQTDKYTDGSGMIYLSSGNIFWVDDKEDMGMGLLFKKTDEIGKEEAAENATEEVAEEAGSEETTTDESATEEPATEETATEETTTETEAAE